MSSTVHQIQDALWAAIVAASGLPEASVIWAEQNAPRLATPFVTLTLAPLRIVGAPVEAFYPAAVETEDFPLVGIREGTLSVNYYGADAPVALDTINASLSRAVVRDALSSMRHVKVTVAAKPTGSVYVLAIDGISFQVATTQGAATPANVAATFVDVIAACSDWLLLGAYVDEAAPAAFHLVGSGDFDFDAAVGSGSVVGGLAIASIAPAVSVAIVERLSLLDLAAVMETGYEGRAQLDLRIRSALRIVDRPGVIQHVEITDVDRGTVVIVPQPEP